jgi:ketosteroid isomerase-like protein
MPYLYGSSAPSTPFADAESTIREQARDFCTAFNTANFADCAELFLPEALLMIPDRDPFVGVKLIERSLRELADAGYCNLRLETSRVDASGDMAIEAGHYSAGIRTPNGGLAIARGKYLAGWRRLGVWRIAAHCWSRTSLVAQESQERQLRSVERPEIIAHDVSRTT